MMNRRMHRGGARGLVVALALLSLAPPSAAAQRPADARRPGPVTRTVRALASDFRNAFAGPSQPQAPRTLRACESMYDNEAREIARGAEPVGSRVRWLDISYNLIRDSGPLPLCFEHLRDTLTTRQGRRLLEINNEYLRRNPSASYWLTGFTDPVEQDTALARRRAEEVHMLSIARDCHRPARGGLQIERRFQRRVYYRTLTHRPPNCPPPPRR